MTTVYVDMVGDMFHSGHVNFLSKAYKLGNYLIVGVMSDEDVALYKRVPVLSLEDRTSVIESCKYVNKVISPCPLVITKEFIDTHNIGLVVHAHDEKDVSYDFMYHIPMELGIFKRLDYTEGISTTEIIKRCKDK